MAGAVVMHNYAAGRVINCSFIENFASTYFGALYFRHFAAGIVAGCEFLGNSASQGGSATGGFLAAIEYYDCLLEANIGSQALASLIGSIHIVRCRFVRNTGGGQWDGGAIAAPFGGVLSITSTLFSENRMPNNADGGAAHLTGGTAAFRNTTFYRNTATRYGGAVFATATATVDFLDCLFFESTAYFGGSLWIEQGSSIKCAICSFERSISTYAPAFWFEDQVESAFRNCTFVDGIASNSAVGQITMNSLALFTDSTFSGNQAFSFSGAIKISSSEVSFLRCLFDSNHALGSDGGALETDAGAQVAIEQSTFVSNRAETYGGAIRAKDSSSVDITRCSFFNNSAGSDGASIYVDGAGTKLSAAASAFEKHANGTSSGFIISGATGDMFALRLDTVSFKANQLPALFSSDLILVQNCDGLKMADVVNVTVGTCADTGAFCLPTSCSDALIGIACYCVVDGVSTIFPTDCMDSAVLELTVPSKRTHTFVIEKPANSTAELVMSNPGASKLVWRAENNRSDDSKAFPWSLTPSLGDIPSTDLAILTLSVVTESIQARAEPYVASFVLSAADASVCVCREQSIFVVFEVIVSASPSAEQSYVTISEHEDALATASSTVAFVVHPVDYTGLSILDASSTVYTATLTSGAAVIRCSVAYDSTEGAHCGQCPKPALIAGAMTVEVRDASGAIVGGNHTFQVTKCPATYLLDEADSICKCAPGSYDKGFECVTCPEGTVATVVGALRCSACPLPYQTSAPARDSCGCMPEYFEDSVGECSRCPDQVVCAWNSTPVDWVLKPGVWRSSASSTELYTCHFGAVSCPGNTSDGADDGCTARGFGDWPHCGCGYVGPMCAVCDMSYFLTWHGTDPTCKACAQFRAWLPTILTFAALAACCVVVGVQGMVIAKRNSLPQYYRVGKMKLMAIGQVAQVLARHRGRYETSPIHLAITPPMFVCCQS